jgi:hypothetical protein
MEMRYKNVSEAWGDAVEATAADYMEQARINWSSATPEDREAEPDMDPAVIRIEEYADGIYVNGDLVAERR